MNVLAKCAVVLVALIAWLPPAAAQENQPQPPPRPLMQPENLGPRTESVDAKTYARVFHVAAGGSDQGDGSQAAPVATISQALSRIFDSGESKRHAILVAAGEYKGETISMKPYVDLFGGFDAKGWKRDIEANRTVLDGEGQRRVVVGADNARIDGFVILNGKVRDPGAGVLCNHTSPTISNNTIINNTTLESEGIDKKMIHQHGNDGAAIACINGSSGTIANNIIAGNTTQLGGGAGIAIANFSMPRILNNVITENETGLTDVNLSRSSNGAAISATNAQHRPPLRMTVVNNVISNNRANGKSDAGGIYLEYDSSPLVAANWLVGNWCEDDGSAIYVMKSSHPLFVGNVVAGNNSSAIRLSKEGRGDLEHNLIFGNAAAVICISSWMNFRNNTIVDNKSGLSYGNSYAPHLKPSIITGNLFYGNEGGQLGAEKGAEAPFVTKNDIQGGYAGGEGNFDQKPQFVDDGFQGQVKSLDYDVHRAVTTIAVGNLTGAGGTLVGRLLRIGDKWGIIKHGSQRKIIAWGDLRPKRQQATEFTIAPTYRLRTELPGDVGSQAKP
ncbi:MAG: right-handed parallel beta-helix repeat-containing protein [Planctomycetes bacterium]|nr:right-handed parallel beta-helix repeat-containing protein [Planctomycetota bacterium]